MKSIKPGRGPSMMESFAGIAAAIFGVIWIIGAVSIGAPWFMAAFGVIFIVLAIAMAVYNAYNATAKNRMSVLDITENGEEQDPLNRAFGKETQASGQAPIEGGARFCPYCGTPIRDDYAFCKSCGKKLPEA